MPPGKRTKSEADGWELSAQDTNTDGSLKLSVGFKFDTKTGGLKCVMFNAFEDDVASLRQFMVKRYGKPSIEDCFASTSITKWQTQDDIELVVGQKPLVAVVTHCMP